MAFLSSLSPVPSFAAYTGPYKVGTQEVEIPASELSASVPPDPSISTISCRIFYPCKGEQKKKLKPVYWLPEPQAEYFRAYARFMQASPWLASLLSYFPLLRPLFHTTIPAHHNAPLLSPPSSRWPTLLFSHGLGGSKNAYSAICGSLASHGIVVLAPDHRDGSSPISFIRKAQGTYKDAQRVEHKSLGRKGGGEFDKQRDHQLRVRCWEMGLAYEALLKIDEGDTLTNLAQENTSKGAVSSLSAFASSLDVHEPGRVAWAGHSFGAATVVQFVKSVFYRDATLLPTPSSALAAQITLSSPTAFLDLWGLPLLSTQTQSLWGKPLPCYAPTTTTASVRPSPPLAILSEGFFNWKSNLTDTLRAVSPPSPTATLLQPHVFYPLSSAHLSQSDFGPLFPWITRKAFKAEEPERTLRLNVRAILENLRQAGLRVADTSRLDMELAQDQDRPVEADCDARVTGGMFSDEAILSTREGVVRGWVAIPPESDGSDAAAAAAAAVTVTDGANMTKVTGKEAAASIAQLNGGTPDSGYDSPGRRSVRERSSSRQAAGWSKNGEEAVH